MRWIAVFCVLSLAGCNGGESSPPPPPQTVAVVTMNPGNWFFQHSPNMPASPISHPAGWSFDFPSQDGVHYLVHPAAGKVPTIMSASFSIEKTGDVKFVESEPCGEHNAKMRLYFQRRGDDLSAAKQNYRWWSIDAFQLAEAVNSISVAIQPGNWSQVFGKSGDAMVADFFAAASDVQAVGMTFGGCFAGHGVYVTGGSARFVATGFSVN